MSLSVMNNKKSEELLSAFRAFFLNNISNILIEKNRKNHLKISHSFIHSTFRIGSNG
jgi:hypothetical protein